MPMSRRHVDSISENELMKNEQKQSVYYEPARTSTGNRKFSLHLCLYMSHASFLSFLSVCPPFCPCSFLRFPSLFFLFLTLHTTFFLFLLSLVCFFSYFLSLYSSTFPSFFPYFYFHLFFVLSFFPTFCRYYIVSFSVFFSLPFCVSFFQSHTDEILESIYFYSDME